MLFLNSHGLIEIRLILLNHALGFILGTPALSLWSRRIRESFFTINTKVKFHNYSWFFRFIYTTVTVFYHLPFILIRFWPFMIATWSGFVTVILPLYGHGNVHRTKDPNFSNDIWERVLRALKTKFNSKSFISETLAWVLLNFEIVFQAPIKIGIPF